MPSSGTIATKGSWKDEALLFAYKGLIDSVEKWDERFENDLELSLDREKYRILVSGIVYKYQAKIITHKNHLVVKGDFEAKSQKGALEALKKSVGILDKQKTAEKTKRENKSKDEENKTKKTETKQEKTDIERYYEIRNDIEKEEIKRRIREELEKSGWRKGRRR